MSGHHLRAKTPEERLPNDGSCYLAFRPDSSECWLRVRFGHVPTPGRCNTCAYLHGHVTLWCKSPEALETFGTNFPGRENCQFWKEPPQDGPALVPIWQLLLFGPPRLA